MSEKIKRINRELKFKGKILDFYQDTIEVDGDHTVVWDFIGHKGAAAVVPVTADSIEMRWIDIHWRFRQEHLMKWENLV